jgi:phosphatidylglycerol:prolipoprotein diacylglycerol transferase
MTTEAHRRRRVYPVPFEIFGISVTAYGVSKMLAALVAAWLLGRASRRLGWDAEVAHNIVVAATVLGFVGAKVYYLAEHWGPVDHHSLSAGFTWYGGVIAATLTVIVMAKRNGLPLAPLAGAAAVPLSVAYGIGRLGCLLAGDGTTGTPTDLPWGVTITAGMVTTDGPVHPTPLYEALAAFAIAALLWSLRTRLSPLHLFSSYLVLSGAARFLVEFLRTNDQVLLGATQPQLWSLLLIVIGAGLLVTRRPSHEPQTAATDRRAAADPASGQSGARVEAV